MKTAFLFVGQGQQYVNMGKDLADKYEIAKNKYEIAKSILGYDLLLLDAKINETLYTQPALYVLACVLDDLLKANNINADIVAGLSLGEYSALYSANVISFEDGLNIIKERAKIMSETSKASSMAAIINADDNLENLLEDLNVAICNYNSAKQVVIGGLSEDVSEAIKVLKAHKYRAIPLSVSTVSHHPLLKSHSAKLLEVLNNYKFNIPTIKFINNLEAKFQSENFNETLARHISEPTLFYQTILLMIENGVSNFIEVGPKGSLSKLVKSINKDVKTSNVYDLETLGDVIYEK